jgi:hypothetical protein
VAIPVMPRRRDRGPGDHSHRLESGHGHRGSSSGPQTFAYGAIPVSISASAHRGLEFGPLPFDEQVVAERSDEHGGHVTTYLSGREGPATESVCSALATWENHSVWVSISRSTMPMVVG